MKKLLWVGDAVVATGFAKATHETLDRLRWTWDVYVLGLNYYGDPHGYPYPIYPCITGGDLWGLARVADLVKALKIDCVVIQNDPWNIPAYVKAIRDAELDVSIVATLAVDGKNIQAGKRLDGLALAIFWTSFAEREARLSGYKGPSAVVPLGVNLEMYKPIDKREARSKLFQGSAGKRMPDFDSFIVGNVNRNQPRKRFDLMVEYFCDWVESRGVPDDAFLMLHSCPTSDNVFNVRQLMDYRGMKDRLLLVTAPIGHGVPEPVLVVEYNMLDAMLTTTQGEGFGLTTLEGMACGIPQIVPDWSALGEICAQGAIKVPCTSRAVTMTENVNVIGGIMDHDGAVEALDLLYRDRDARLGLGMEALALARRPEFRWETIGERFAEALDLALSNPEALSGDEWRSIGRPAEAVA